MKTKMLSVLILMGLVPFALFAGPVKTEKFKVAGNCSMCETRIEKAANSVDGVSNADWNKETKMIEVTYDVSATNLQKISEAIAKAGHDTERVKASDETYENLPACCHYERMTVQKADGNSKSAMEGHGDHSHHQ